MILSASSEDSKFLAKADRIGIGASVLCAIHCAVAPFLLLMLPAFGKIWAHPLSHILVAMLVVPLAAFSIRRGYLTHQKRWVLVTAYIGIFVVLTGAALPAFSKESQTPIASPNDSEAEGESVFTFSVSDDSETEEANTEEESVFTFSVDDEAEPENSKNEGECEMTDDTQCIDDCCPSLQVSETGETYLNVPPAAIASTLGGLFLIVAHVGNICACGHSCRNGKCKDC
tara:strand:+ start:759 stop:1445 length:687 start_codon:yes stop_codon:yes gene_type:complete